MKYAIGIVAFACLSQAAYAAESRNGGGDSVSITGPPSGKPSVEVLRKVAEKIGECIAGNHSLHGQAVDFVLSGKPSDADRLATVGCFFKGLSAENVRGYALQTYGVYIPCKHGRTMA